jgi:NADH-quinone oxidoreductase F subunit
MSALRIYVPGDAAAVACGADELADAITALAAKRKQPVEIVRNGSRGMHWLEPMVEVAIGNGRIAYGPVEVADVESVFDAMVTSGGPHRLRIGIPEEHPFLKKQTRLTFARCGIVDPRSLDDYKAHDGYKGFAKALTNPAGIVQEVTDSGLRGRGGAGFSTGMKWSFVPAANPKPKYLILNDDESEPGTFKDKMLTERDPHAIIEGAIIAAYAIGAHHVYWYLRGEFALGAKIAQAAVQEAYERGFIGPDPFGTKYAIDFTIHRGAGAYICGEETGLITSLEGQRGYPKIKPPFPAVEGYFRCPTIVNNVATIATVPGIVNNGVEWFRRTGTEKAPGTMIFSVSGHVERPGLYETPLGIPLRELIELAGGVRGGKKLKAVVPGGMSSPVLTADEVDVKMDFDSLAAAKSMLGSAGVYVMDESTCMVDALYNTLRFYHHESCGQCTPCREGTGWLEKILHRLEDGHGRTEDLKLLTDICDGMVGRTICVLADAAAMPTRSFVQKFKAEFDAHIERRGCPLKMQEAPAAAPAGAR